MSAEPREFLAFREPELVGADFAAAIGVDIERRVEWTVGEAAKRTLDFVLACLGLALAAPILLIAALLVRFTSDGPVLFKQIRVGRFGEPFTCYKFRTMVTGAEVILQTDQDLAAKFRHSFKLHKDPRVTGVGRWLRKLSIDELPQLWNVARGEMSIVGPRPVLYPELIEKYGENAPAVVSVRPGLTGLWQVSGRCNLTYAERVALDVKYVEERTFAGDLAIIARTPGALLFMRGAV